EPLEQAEGRANRASRPGDRGRWRPAADHADSSSAAGAATVGGRGRRRRRVGGLMTSSARWRAIGTSAEVFVTDEAELSDARRILEDELEAIDLACSRFRDDSELALVNGSPGRWVEVSDLFLEALYTALAAARATAGDVDPTVGRALRVAGYDRDFAELPAVRTGRVKFVPAPGWRLVQVDTRRLAVRVPCGVELDFGATAKALAADRAA